jgi:hypothetical protein
MANIVNNLLKLTDYPFAYSVAGLVLSMSGQAGIWQNPSVSAAIPFVTLARLLATSLSITDPFGRATPLSTYVRHHLHNLIKN